MCLYRRDATVFFLALGLFRVEMLVGFRDEPFDALAFATIDGNSDACGESRRLFVLREDCVDALRNAFGFFLFGFGKDEGKFVSAVTGGSVDRAAVDAESVRDAADGAAADEMAVGVVHFFEPVKVQQEECKGAGGTIGAFGLVFKDIEQAAIVGKAGERVADREMTDLFEKAGVVEERAA